MDSKGSEAAVNDCLWLPAGGIILLNLCPIRGSVESSSEGSTLLLSFRSLISLSLSPESTILIVYFLVHYTYSNSIEVPGNTFFLVVEKSGEKVFSVEKI